MIAVKGRRPDTIVVYHAVEPELELNSTRADTNTNSVLSLLSQVGK